MGPPGAGKGTQAKRLSEKYAMRHLSSGDILRAERAAGSALGRELARYMDAGALVPDETIVKVMVKALTGGSDGQGILLDGFPRTVPQAQALDAQLAQAGKPLDAVAVIDASRDEIVARITGRRSCPRCGRAYHVTFLRPRRDDLCDDCGQALTRRSDDTEAVVRQRLEAYDRQTEPVIAYYRRRPGLKVLDIDGSAAPDEVTRRLQRAFDALVHQG